ncbi:AAA family ATPase [Paenibacillus dakarensis]|uniref:AAA family ATPase n=1 Tax=Paenibacillus dakarensis TaxID=1527293 RepID=UPI0006D535BA|nr:AAA family ATPase [Paenibacillus dakarensis]
MRIQKINIRGFGAVHDRELELNGKLSVLFGPNEAGKSSVLYFIRAMLYGFPGRALSAQRGEPKAGGIHGGELSLWDENGSRWMLSRYGRSPEGSSGGSRSERLQITVQDGEGTAQELGQQELERDLLGGVSENMFRQLFAISLSELEEIRTLQSEEMNRYLFHAGIGGGHGIVQAERKLNQEMEKLYKPRGRVQESAKIIQDIEQLRRRIAESGSYLKQYNGVISELDNIDTALEQLELRRQSSLKDLMLYRKAVEIRPVWLSWKEDLLEKSDLPDISAFPSEGLNRWEQLREEYKGLDLRREQILKRAADTRSALERLPEQPVLEKLGPDIEAIWSRRPLYIAGKTEKEKLRSEFGILEDRLFRILQDIDGSWTPHHLASFKVSAAQREEIRRMGSSFAGYDRRMETLSFEQRGAMRTLAASEVSLREAQRSLQEEIENGKSHFYMIKPTEPRETLTLWNKLQLEAERWREARMTGLSGRGAGTLQDTLPSKGVPALHRNLLVVLSTLTIVLPAILFGAGAPEAAAAAAALLAVMDIYIWWNGRRVKAAQGGSVETARTAVNGEQEVITLISDLIGDPYAAVTEEITNGRGMKGTAANIPADPVQMEARLREIRKMMDEWQAWQQRLQRLAAEVNTAKERVSQNHTELKHIERVIQQEEKRFLELEQQWESWLEERLLPHSLSPDAVMDILSSAEQGNELIRQLQSLSPKIDVLSQEEARFKKDCVLIERELGIKETEADPFEAVYQEWKAYKETIHERKLLTGRLDELQAEEVIVAEAISRLQEEKNELLKTSRTENEEDFLRLGTASIRAEQLEQSIRHGEVVMFSGWNPEERAQIEFILEQSDKLELEIRCQEIEKAAEADEAARDELQERRGRLLQEKESLEQKGLHEDTLQQLKEKQAALKDIAVQYVIRSIGMELISRTRKIYEEEKQPQVLRLASVYFSRLTGGAYTRVLMRMGDQMLLAEQAGGTVVESSRLSRGTAEQLYLAMRLALVELMPNKVKLPLVLDDIFVNFDSERLGYALQLLAEVSSGRQIIMMTCHEHVVQRIRELSPSAQWIQM